MVLSALNHVLDVVVLAAAPVAGGGVKNSIVRFFQEGGPLMYVNIFWMAVAIAVIVERIVTLLFRYNLNAEPFMDQITKLVLQGNVDRAVKLCRAAPNHRDKTHKQCVLHHRGAALSAGPLEQRSVRSANCDERIHEQSNHVTLPPLPQRALLQKLALGVNHRAF